MFVRIEEYLTDYLLYPFMLYRGGRVCLTGLRTLLGIEGEASVAAGYWFGFGLMFGLSVGINLAYLRVHDASARDWFGFEALRAFEARLSQRWSRSVRTPVRLAVFAFLTLWASPVFATLWLRSRTEQYAMSRGDWFIFGAAILTANLGWTGLIAGAALVLRLLNVVS